MDESSEKQIDDYARMDPSRVPEPTDRDVVEYVKAHYVGYARALADVVLFLIERGERRAAVHVCSMLVGQGLGQKQEEELVRVEAVDGTVVEEAKRRWM
jgi:hypothetical protein